MTFFLHGTNRGTYPPGLAQGRVLEEFDRLFHFRLFLLLIADDRGPRVKGAGEGTLGDLGGGGIFLSDITLEFEQVISFIVYYIIQEASKLYYVYF